jgi:hypothetical protein
MVASPPVRTAITPSCKRYMVGEVQGFRVAAVSIVASGSVKEQHIIDQKYPSKFLLNCIGFSYELNKMQKINRE